MPLHLEVELLEGGLDRLDPGEPGAVADQLRDDVGQPIEVVELDGDVAVEADAVTTPSRSGQNLERPGGPRRRSGRGCRTNTARRGDRDDPPPKHGPHS